jgi:hypothetical protein
VLGIIGFFMLPWFWPVVGLLTGWLCTKFGGEGKATVDAMTKPSD